MRKLVKIESQIEACYHCPFYREEDINGDVFTECAKSDKDMLEYSVGDFNPEELPIPEWCELPNA